MTCERATLGQKGIRVVHGILEKAFKVHISDSPSSFREECSGGSCGRLLQHMVGNFEYKTDKSS